MNEEIKQAMVNLEHLVECRCDEAYTGRGRHDPHSACDYAEEVKIVADYVAFIEAKLATCEKYRDAYAECDRIGTQAVRDLEAKLAKAVEALEHIAAEASVPVYTWKNGINFKKMYEGWREIATSRIDIARKAIGEIKGETE